MSAQYRIGLVLSLVLVPVTCQATDWEAMQFLQDAQKAWSHRDPNKPIDLLKKALERAESPPYRITALSMLGQVYLARLDDVENSLLYSDKVIEQTEGSRDPNLMRLRGEAFCNKGNIYTFRRDDQEKGLAFFEKALEAQRNSINLDIVAIVYYRLSRGLEATEKEKADRIARSVKLSEEAIAGMKRNPQIAASMPKVVAKIKLQYVIGLTATGKLEQADKEYRSINSTNLAPGATSYQQATLHHLRKGTPDEIASILRRGMEAAPTAKSRNMMRDIIRKDPDFLSYLEDSSWKDLVEDEPVPREKPREEEKKG